MYVEIPNLYRTQAPYLSVNLPACSRRAALTILTIDKTQDADMASPLAKLSLIGGKMKKLAEPSNPVIKAQSKVAPRKLFVSRTVKVDFLKG